MDMIYYGKSDGYYFYTNALQNVFFIMCKPIEGVSVKKDEGIIKKIKKAFRGNREDGGDCETNLLPSCIALKYGVVLDAELVLECANLVGFHLMYRIQKFEGRRGVVLCGVHGDAFILEYLLGKEE